GRPERAAGAYAGAAGTVGSCGTGLRRGGRDVRHALAPGRSARGVWAIRVGVAVRSGTSGAVPARAVGDDDGTETALAAAFVSAQAVTSTILEVKAPPTRPRHPFAPPPRALRALCRDTPAVRR
ncbi:hypothetical protein ABT255_60995, partial [Streptomyces mirabilis]|uniref:hypothetical protein n=1 Tax=Streptomyces mirabilis TaxID=68239 RepID=UPI003316E1E5